MIGLHLVCARFFRFLFWGLLNTALTYSLYYLAKNWVSYHIAYMISFFLGVCFSFVVNSVFVFRSRMRLGSFFAYPLVYLFQYVCSALGMFVLVEWVGVSNNVAPLVVTVLTVPLTYLLSGKIIQRDKVQLNE